MINSFPSKGEKKKIKKIKHKGEWHTSSHAESRVEGGLHVFSQLLMYPSTQDHTYIWRKTTIWVLTSETPSIPLQMTDSILTLQVMQHIVLHGVIPGDQVIDLLKRRQHSNIFSKQNLACQYYDIYWMNTFATMQSNIMISKLFSWPSFHASIYIVYLSVCPTDHQFFSVHPSIHPSSLSLCLSIRPMTDHQYICLPIHPSIHPTIHFSCLSIHPSIHSSMSSVYLCMYIHLSVCPSDQTTDHQSFLSVYSSMHPCIHPSIHPSIPV